MSNVLVSPSLLSSNFAKLSEEIDAVLKAGADWLHIDVMDGHFVPNITMGPPVLKSIRQVTDAVLDVHLMIEDPDKYIEDFVKAGADIVTVHVETLKDPKATLRRIKELGAKPGITLRPSTSIEKILPWLADVDLILIMTVEPGFSGQKFMSGPVEDIKTVREKLTELNHEAHIEVDGGINEETSQIVRDAGATVLVSGSYIFKNDYRAAIAQLKGKE